MAYPQGAVERAMKVQEVIVQALAGKLTWWQAADILGRSPCSIRRLRWRLEHYGDDGLFDRRRRVPSPKRAPVAEGQRQLVRARAFTSAANRSTDVRVTAPSSTRRAHHRVSGQRGG